MVEMIIILSWIYLTARVFCSHFGHSLQNRSHCVFFFIGYVSIGLLLQFNQYKIQTLALYVKTAHTPLYY